MDLCDLLILGFEKPSAIQKRAIKPIITGRDVICQAQSGTGKTATIAMTSLQRINPKQRDVQVLVLSPTRELAVQIQRVSIFIISISILLEFIVFFKDE